MTEFGLVFTAINGVVLLLGLLVGAAVTHLAFPARKQLERLRAQLDQALQDKEKYETSVNSHFRKTAELVGEMTRSYAAVYDHLAVGARTFCGGGDDNERVPFGPRPGALASPSIDTTAEEGEPFSRRDNSTAAEAAEDSADSGDFALGEGDALDSASASETSTDDEKPRGSDV